MIKQEFKRIFAKILVRIIILFLFLILCYLMGSSNVKADTINESIVSRYDRMYQYTSYVNGWQLNTNNISCNVTTGSNPLLIEYCNTKSQVSGRVGTRFEFDNFNINDGTYDINFYSYISGYSDAVTGDSISLNLGGQGTGAFFCSSTVNGACQTYWANPISGTIELNSRRKMIVMVNGAVCEELGNTRSNYQGWYCRNVKITNKSLKILYIHMPSDSTTWYGMGNINVLSSSLDIQAKQLDEQKETNNHLKDSDTTNAQNGGTSFFDNFQNPISSSGLSGIVGAPITLLQNLLTGTCTPLHLNIPFVNKEFDLPCMSTIYQQNFGTFLQVYRIITFGIITYWVIIKCIGIVKNLVDPDDDKIEVLDL